MIEVQSSRLKILPGGEGSSSLGARSSRHGNGGVSRERVCRRPEYAPQNTLLWHEDYFELKAIEKTQTQDELSAVPHA